MKENLWLLLQLVDSSFPTGGFVHSGGLEAATQSGLVKDRESIFKYLNSQMKQTIQLYIPIVSVAYHCGRDMEKFGEIDQFCESVITNNVANRSSRTQGIALLSTCANAFPWSDLISVKKYILANDLYAHQSTVFGLVYNILGIDLATTQELFLYSTLRAFISTAIRLNIIGPIEAQNVQHTIGLTSQKELDSFLERQIIKYNNTKNDNSDKENKYNNNNKINAGNTSEYAKSIWNMEGKYKELEKHLEVFQISPLLDLVQGMQDRLYSRMFNS